MFGKLASLKTILASVLCFFSCLIFIAAEFEYLPVFKNLISSFHCEIGSGFCYPDVGDLMYGIGKLLNMRSHGPV